MADDYRYPTKVALLAGRGMLDKNLVENFRRHDVLPEGLSKQQGRETHYSREGILFLAVSGFLNAACSASISSSYKMIKQRASRFTDQYLSNDGDFGNDAFGECELYASIYNRGFDLHLPENIDDYQAGEKSHGEYVFPQPVSRGYVQALLEGIQAGNADVISVFSLKNAFSHAEKQMLKYDDGDRHND